MNTIVLSQLPVQQVSTPQIQSGSQTHRQWNSNICDCCIDCSSCCYAFLCPCCAFGRIARTVDDKSKCTGCCRCLCCTVIPCSVFIRAPYRKKLRVKYNLPAKPCNDFCTSFWCPCCALAQEVRELKSQSNIKPVEQKMM